MKTILTERNVMIPCGNIKEGEAFMLCGKYYYRCNQDLLEYPRKIVLRGHTIEDPYTKGDVYSLCARVEDGTLYAINNAVTVMSLDLVMMEVSK